MFCFRLALALGRTVGELLEVLSYEEFLRWMEYDALQPIGDRRADIRTAMVLTQTANLHRDRKTRSTPYTFSEFMPFEKRTAELMTVARPASEGARIAGSTISYLVAMADKSGHDVSQILADEKT